MRARSDPTRELLSTSSFGQNSDAEKNLRHKTASRQRAGPSDEHLGPAISLEGVSKIYGRGLSAIQALDKVSIDVGFGEFVCIVGASGCGKSTLLNLVAGLDEPTVGTVAVRVRTALIFQEPALFPWLSVWQNTELPLKLQNVRRDHRGQVVKALLEMVRLKGFEHRRPHELSGGMRQRAALARALAQRAEVLLMDEPFGALDAITRDVMHQEIEELWGETGFTVLFVTHNVREAVRLGDRVLVMSSRPGRIIRQFEVPLSRPRRIESNEVAEIAAEIVDALHREVRAHGLVSHR